MNEFRYGDRVKLTKKAADVAMHGIRPRRKKINWYERRGTVVHNTTPGSGSVIMQWDDLTTKDSWPKVAVERVE